MPFFELPPLPPDPQGHSGWTSIPPWTTPPRWIGPPETAIGVTVALDLVLGCSDRGAVWIPALTVYAYGFTVEFEERHLLELDLDPDEPPHLLTAHHYRGNRPGELTPPPDLLCLGLQFADGRKATNLDTPFRLVPRGTAPAGPTFTHVPGMGGATFWVWPLPPPGPLAFVCEWPLAGIELRRVEVDAALVFDAAREGTEGWADEPKA